MDRVKEVDSGIVWGADDETVFYTKMDDEHRPFQVWRHTVGQDSAADELLFEEQNQLFWVNIGKTLDGKFMLISSASSETSEVHSVDLKSGDPKEKAKVVAARRQGVLYEVDHREGHFFIVSLSLVLLRSLTSCSDPSLVRVNTTTTTTKTKKEERKKERKKERKTDF